jgi:hypothetical protein
MYGPYNNIGILEYFKECIFLRFYNLFCRVNLKPQGHPKMDGDSYIKFKIIGSLENGWNT